LLLAELEVISPENWKSLPAAVFNSTYKSRVSVSPALTTKAGAKEVTATLSEEKEALPDSLLPFFSNQILVLESTAAKPNDFNSTVLTETSESPAVRSTAANLIVPEFGI
jgi:hypothetical protein